MAKRGRPPKIDAGQQALLVEIVESNPTATLREMQQELASRGGVKAHEQTIQKALRDAGFERKASTSSVKVEVSKPTAPRYGYTDAHRCAEPEQTYPSCLTDAEWALVEDLFDNTGNRGVPPQFDRRALVDACCGAHRLLLADVAERVSGLAERIPDVSPLERTGQVRADARPLTRTMA
jgi:hypothetical protein